MRPTTASSRPGARSRTAYLDGVEKYVNGVARSSASSASSRQLEPIAGVLSAQAKLTRGLTSASVSAARELIAALEPSAEGAGARAFRVRASLRVKDCRYDCSVVAGGPARARRPGAGRHERLIDRASGPGAGGRSTAVLRIACEHLASDRPPPTGTPACSYSVSAETFSVSAIACSTCSDGARRPRSICDRYGLEIPASRANSRIDIADSSRWRRMKSPREDSGSDIVQA